MKTSEAARHFILAARADGLRPATVKWYISLIDAFVRQFGERELTSITTVEIREYIIGLREREERFINAPQKPTQPGRLSAATVNGHVTALHSFWAWVSREYSTANPMQNIKRPKRPTPQPKAVATADFVRLFNATGDGDAGTRDRALLAFLADTGVRMGGLLSLRVDDLDLDGRRAVVIEKGSKKRTVVFTRATARFLLAWLSVRHSESDKVFTTVTGARNALTAGGLEQILKRLKKRAGVEGRVNPHAFRHAFAREYLRAGGDVVTLARLLGHSDINTTAAYYAVFSQDELAEMHEKFSPFNRLIESEK